MINAPMNQSEKFDMLTKYFLRALAIEKRRKLVNPEQPYRNALMEVIGITLIYPILGFFSFVLIATAKWTIPYAKRISSPGHGMSFEQKAMFAIGITVIAMVVAVPIGRRVFGRKFDKYRGNPDACLAFGSERDATVFKAQRLAIGFLLLMSSIFLGLLVTYLAGG